MRGFRNNQSHDLIIGLLYGTTHKNAGQPIFVTKRELLCFAAVLGFEGNRRNKILDKPTDFVDSRNFENSQDATNLLYLIGLAVTKDVDCLREEKEEELVTIFEEFADGGLCTLEEWLRETPSDPHGDRAIIEALKRHGFLAPPDEPIEAVVAEVEF
jgi:dnd system-associated protein 4